MLGRFLRLGAVASLAIIVCTASFAGSGAAAPSSASAQARTPADVETFDKRLAKLARQFPAFGGIFVDETSDTLFVYLTHPDQNLALQVARAVKELLGSEELPRNTKPLGARYAFLELKEWHHRMRDLHRIPGVVMTDIDDAQNRLTVGVETPAAKQAVLEQLPRLGIPGEAVDVIPFAAPRMQSSLRDRHRPLVGGLQVDFNPASWGGATRCTLGFLAVQSDGTQGFVTNAHCTATQGGVGFTFYYQPTVDLPNVVGLEVVDPPYFTDGDCPNGRACRFSDSALVLNFVIPRLVGTIAQPAVGSFAWDGTTVFSIVATNDPVVGNIVQKVGRSTGRTTGTVTRVCQDVRQNTPAGVDTGITLLCQAQASYASAGGDSGSPVFRRRLFSSTNVSLRGIQWGGNGTFSPIMNVFDSSTELGPLCVTTSC